MIQTGQLLISHHILSESEIVTLIETDFFPRLPTSF